MCEIFFFPLFQKSPTKKYLSVTHTTVQHKKHTNTRNPSLYLRNVLLCLLVILVYSVSLAMTNKYANATNEKYEQKNNIQKYIQKHHIII